MKVHNQSNQVHFNPVDLSTIQTRSYEYGNNDSLSKKQMSSCWPSTKSFFSTVFSKIWAAIKWIFCCGCSSSIDPIDLGQILKAPEDKAKEFAKRPAQYYGALLNELSKDPKKALETLEKSTNEKSFKEFKAALKKEIGTAELIELNNGKGDIKQAIQVGMGHSAEKTITGDKTKYNHLKEIQDNLPNNAENIAKKFCDKLATYIEENSKEEASPEQKQETEDLKKFIKELPSQMETFKEMVSKSEDLQTWKKEIFSLKLGEEMQKNFKVLFRDFCAKELASNKLNNALFEKLNAAPHLINPGFADLKEGELGKMVQDSIQEEISENILPELIKFLGEDHPLMAEKLKFLSGFVPHAKPESLQEMNEIVEAIAEKTGLKI